MAMQTKKKATKRRSAVQAMAPRVDEPELRATIIKIERIERRNGGEDALISLPAWREAAVYRPLYDLRLLNGGKVEEGMLLLAFSNFHKATHSGDLILVGPYEVALDMAHLLADDMYESYMGAICSVYTAKNILASESKGKFPNGLTKDDAMGELRKAANYLEYIGNKLKLHGAPAPH